MHTLMEEVLNIIRNALYTPDNLNWIGLCRNAVLADVPMQQKLVSDHVEATLTLAGDRAWAKLAQLLPPWCYAGLFSVPHYTRALQ